MCTGIEKRSNSVTVQNRTHVYMNFFDHKDLGNHLLQLCPKVVKHPVYIYIYMYTVHCIYTQFDFNKAGLVKDIPECNYCITQGVSLLVCTDEAFFNLPCGYALQYLVIPPLSSLLYKYH